jgi:hypothetical protein
MKGRVDRSAGMRFRPVSHQPFRFAANKGVWTMIDLPGDTAHSTGKRGWERASGRLWSKGAAFTISQIGGMTVSISLKREVWRLLQETNSSRVPAMEKQTGDLTMFRHELVHGDDAEFIAYQRQLGDGAWQTLSRWMIPGTDCLD